MTRINFKPYTRDQLIKIVEMRLECVERDAPKQVPEFIHTDAIKFAASKVASVSGDARRVLDICR
jgi:origin recognition complex subunit 1